MAPKTIWKRCADTALVRNIAVRLARFHNWNFPSSEGAGAKRGHLWIGRYGEQAAESWCRAQGWNVLRRNWKSDRKGEIDLVCRDGDCLVFAEVKTRTGSKYGPPSRAVNRDKRRLIRSGGRHWLRSLHDDSISYRYDIIEVIVTSGQPPCINHIPFAFGDSDT